MSTVYRVLKKQKLENDDNDDNVTKITHFKHPANRKSNLLIQTDFVTKRQTFSFGIFS